MPQFDYDCNIIVSFLPTFAINQRLTITESPTWECGRCSIKYIRVSNWSLISFLYNSQCRKKLCHNVLRSRVWMCAACDRHYHVDLVYNLLAKYYTRDTAIFVSPQVAHSGVCVLKVAMSGACCVLEFVEVVHSSAHHNDRSSACKADFTSAEASSTKPLLYIEDSVEELAPPWGTH